jgi:LuxR family maltose regulon positive regulatory protein
MAKKPVVRNGHLQLEGQPTAVGTDAWRAWLAAGQSFIVEGAGGRFTARAELRQGAPYWYAYRRHDGRLRKIYLGKADDLSPARLAEAELRLLGRATPTPDAPPDAPSDSPPAPLSLPITRLRPPALPHNLIDRPRLTQRMTTPVVLLVAPGGYGKSTVLNAWRHGGEHPTAWVLLDPEDNDPRRFWQGVTTALQLVGPALCVPPPAAADSHASRAHVIALINELSRLIESRDLPHGLALVLDDFHHIRNPQIHQDISFLLENAPPRSRFLLAGHSRPPLALGQLAMRGLITELTAADLRFTEEEGMALLGQRFPGTPLAHRTLVKRTEGWAAGLNLIALSLSSLDNVDQFMATFAWQNAYFREFFMDDVLHSQPAYIQRFLLRTSPLQQFNAPLCDAVTGEPGAADILRRLWEQNLFITRLAEGEGEWYRYHELFAHALRAELHKQHPEEIADLHRRAAQWYRAQGAPEDAVRHLLSMAAWPEAADLIESVALNELQRSGEDSRLLRWLQQLPESAVQNHRTLLLAYTRLASIALSPVEVDRFLERVRAAIRAKPPEEQSADERDVLREIDRFQRLPAGAAEPPPDRRNGAIWPVLDLISAGLRWHDEGQIDRAEAAYLEALTLARAQGNSFGVLLAGGACARAAWLQGHLRRAETQANDVLGWAAARHTQLPSPASIALLVLSQISYERNRLGRARDLLQQASAIDPDPTSANRPLLSALLLAAVEVAEGQDGAARLTLDAAAALSREERSSLVSHADVVAFSALLWAQAGDTAAAETALALLGEVAPADVGRLARGRLLLAQGRPEAAGALLGRLVAGYPQGLRLRPLLDAQLGLALALFGQQRLGEARQVLANAVRAAAPEGMVRPFLDYGRAIMPMLALLQQTERFSTVAAGFLQETLGTLEASHGRETTVSRAALAEMTTAAAVSPREQEILRLISQGLSSRAIADRLIIAPSTVKTHLKNIYRKLDVTGRAQAVARAQALGLLGAGGREAGE